MSMGPTSPHKRAIFGVAIASKPVLCCQNQSKLRDYTIEKRNSNR